MAGIEDLATLLAGMRPELAPGRYVFTTTTEAVGDVAPFARIEEDEGSTLVLTVEEAERAGLAFDFVAARITLTVHSSLAAVGLTAAVASALAEAGISCNVVAGYFHDHLFVPWAEADRALAVLAARAG